MIWGFRVDYSPVFLAWFGIRILYGRVSGVLRRMDKPRALVCYVFGSIRRSSRVRFEGTCVNSVHAVLPERVICGLLWRIVLPSR